MDGQLSGFPTSGDKSIRRIVLTGFMAAGKTTVGRLLAQKLGWGFVDTDQHIEASTRLTVAEIFRDQGEPSFRQLEREAISSLLTGTELVLATGGGAIEDASTRVLLLSSPGTRLIYLETTLQTAVDRCGPVVDPNEPELSSAEPSSREAVRVAEANLKTTLPVRPLMSDRATLESRYLRRLPLYRQSHHSIIVDNLDPIAVTDAILTLLNLPAA